MSVTQWLREHYLLPKPFPTAGDEKYAAAMVVTKQAREAVQSLRFPDPFSPWINEVRRSRAVSKYDMAEAADIYEHLPDEKKVIKPDPRGGLVHQFINETKAPK